LKKIAALFAVLATSITMLVGATVASAHTVIPYPPYYTCGPFNNGAYTSAYDHHGKLWWFRCTNYYGGYYRWIVV
jgi:hypothetical protein